MGITRADRVGQQPVLAAPAPVQGGLVHPGPGGDGLDGQGGMAVLGQLGHGGVQHGRARARGSPAGAGPGGVGHLFPLDVRRSPINATTVALEEGPFGPREASSMEPLPPARPGTALRVLATTDLAGTLVPIRTSYGEGGTCAGVVELLERERDRQPTVWLDAGDFTVGPTSPLLGERPWADMAALPITAAAAGNHEFDDGVPALLEAARLLPYPLLCANVEVGLPPAAMVETGAGPLGVIGLTHPHVHRLSQAPPPAEDWPERVGQLARQLRSQGARWVAAILHDGVDW